MGARLRSQPARRALAARRAHRRRSRDVHATSRDDSAALRAADSLAIFADDPAAAADEIQRRQEEIGFSYFVFGAEVSRRTRAGVGGHNLSA